MMNPTVSIDFSVIAILAIVAVVIGVALLSSKKFSTGIIALASIGLLLFVGAGILLSFVGLRRGPSITQTRIGQSAGDWSQSLDELEFSPEVDIVINLDESDKNRHTDEDEGDTAHRVHVVSIDSHSSSESECENECIAKVVAEDETIDVSKALAETVATVEQEDREEDSEADDDVWSEDPTVMDDADSEIAGLKEEDLDGGDLDGRDLDDGDLDDGDSILEVTEKVADRTPVRSYHDADFDDDSVADQIMKKVSRGDETRPAWAFEEWQIDEDLHQLTVPIGPYPTWQQVDRTTETAIREEVSKYAKWYLASLGRSEVSAIPAGELQIPMSRVKHRIAEVFDHLHESSSDNVEDMPMRYVLLEFDERFRKRYIEPSLRESLSVARAKQAGLFSGGILAIMASAFGLLKVSSTAGDKPIVRTGVMTASAFLAAAAIATVLLSVFKR